MIPSFDFDLGIRETDPIRKFLVLVVAMAHEDGATALVLGGPQPNQSSTPIRFRDNGTWADFPPYPEPMSRVASELERMAGFSETASEGVLECTVAAVKMRWRVQ